MQRIPNLARRALLLSAAILFASSAAHAAWPEQPIKMIVGYGPGGGTDIPARLIAP